MYNTISRLNNEWCTLQPAPTLQITYCSQQVNNSKKSLHAEHWWWKLVPEPCSGCWWSVPTTGNFQSIIDLEVHLMPPAISSGISRPSWKPQCLHHETSQFRKMHRCIHCVGLFSWWRKFRSFRVIVRMGFLHMSLKFEKDWGGDFLADDVYKFWSEGEWIYQVWASVLRAGRFRSIWAWSQAWPDRSFWVYRPCMQLHWGEWRWEAWRRRKRQWWPWPWGREGAGR